jgi:uncharacterized membrane protein
MFRIIYSLIFTSFSGLIIGMAFFAPVVQELIGYPNGENIYVLLSNICHQYPLNSFWILERPFAVCARCFSAYFAILIMSLLFLQNRIKLGFITGMILLFVAAIEPIGSIVTSFESNLFTRGMFGFIGGIGVFNLLFFPLTKKRKHVEKYY